MHAVVDDGKPDLMLKRNVILGQLILQARVIRAFEASCTRDREFLRVLRSSVVKRSPLVGAVQNPVL